MDQKANPIQPPPSVEDLLALGAEARLGQVDFANRLVPTSDDAHPTPAPASADAGAGAGMATVTSVPPRRRPVAAAPEVAEAVVDPEVEALVEPDPAPKTKPAPRSRPKPAAKAAKPASKAKPAPDTKRKPARSPQSAQPVVEPVVEAAAGPAVEPVIPAILPIANLSGDAVSASAAYDDEFSGHQVPATRVVADTAATLRIPVESVPAPVVEASADFGDTVQEIADAAIERLRDAENATLQHLAALEAEAARRAELLTAQAELDAELIRITARREAHAIISAARSEAGLGAPSSRDARQLTEISDAVSRFAESIESTLTPMHSHASQGDQA
ncbi:hypothetical protein GCM10023350_24160 [Nocardioides endophyticus]|uniref:Uncharacterized protein n=1 Tax=Nocardioides endophyticus TaxID=1353775 RepID=A0ABP8YYU1_9ACTN